jgi:hypothetical protein
VGQAGQVPALRPEHPLEYEPGSHEGQSVQLPWLTPLHPERYLLPVHAGHAVQVPEAAPAQPSAYDPALQAVQAPHVFLALYCPEGQGVVQMSLHMTLNSVMSADTWP